MKHLAIEAEKKNEILQRMSSAVQENDTEKFAQAWTDLADTIQEAVLEQSKELIASNDSAVLAQRGIRQLTGDENKYWQKMIDAMRSADPKQAIALIDDVMPTTVIDEIFTYLTGNHPLLSIIDFQNTGAIVEWIMSTSSGVAGWSELCAEIQDELSGAFSVIELGKLKLSAFIPVCNAMLDLGPVWLDRYVRTLLAEAIAVALEAAIVDGDGNKKPLGMTRALTGDTGGVFPRKTPIVVKKLDPETYGSLLNTLSQAPNNKRRPVQSIMLLVNPTDYFTKVFPATTVRNAIGTYNHDIFPFPTDPIQSVAVPSNMAIVGLPKRYFMGLGTGTPKGGKIEYSDEYKFLEDQRVYRVKLYGNGRPMDDYAFLLLDITNLEPDYPKFIQVPEV